MWRKLQKIGLDYFYRREGPQVEGFAATRVAKFYRRADPLGFGSCLGPKFQQKVALALQIAPFQRYP